MTLHTVDILSCIFRLRRAHPRNQDILLLCDELENRLLQKSLPLEVVQQAPYDTTEAVQPGEFVPYAPSGPHPDCGDPGCCPDNPPFGKPLPENRIDLKQAAKDRKRIYMREYMRKRRQEAKLGL